MSSNFPFTKEHIVGTAWGCTSNTYIRWRFPTPIDSKQIFCSTAGIWYCFTAGGGAGGVGTSSTGIRGGGGAGGGGGSGTITDMDEPWVQVTVGSGGSCTGSTATGSYILYQRDGVLSGPTGYGGERGDTTGNSSTDSGIGFGGYYYNSAPGWAPGGAPNGYCGGGGAGYWSTGEPAPSTTVGGNGTRYPFGADYTSIPYTTNDLVGAPSGRIYWGGGGGGCGEVTGGNATTTYNGGRGGSQTLAPTSGKYPGAGGGGAGYDTYGCS